MKPPIRRASEFILRVTLRFHTQTNREWADAMRGELDFIQSDWAALIWAFGGASALAKKSLVSLIFGREARGFALGVGLAASLLLFAMGVLWLLMSYPTVSFANSESFHIIVAILIPEMIFVAAIVALRKNRKPVAVGIAMLAFVLAAHVVIHVATRGW